MICPNCKTINASVKKICAKCNRPLPLSPTVSGPGFNIPPHQATQNEASKKSKKKKYFIIYTIIALSGLMYVAYMVTAIPKTISSGENKLSKKETAKANLKFKNLAFYGKNNREITNTVNAAELNRFIQKNYNLVKRHTRQDSISVDGLYIDISSGNITLIFKTYVKFKHIYICLAGKPVKKGHQLKLIINTISIGKLKLPAKAGPFIAKLIKSKGNPLAFELPTYIKDLKFKNETLTISIGR